MDDATKTMIANFKSDGDPAFGPKPETEKVEETPAPQAEKTDKEAPSQEGVNTPDEDKTPFHKHPRWVARNREVQELRKQVEALTQKAEVPTQTDAQLPEWWVKIYGDSPESHNAFANHYSKHEDDLVARAKREIVEDQNREKAAYSKEVNKWEEHIDNEIEGLRDMGLRFERNKLLKIVEDYSPKDDQGNIVGLISFEKAYEILQLSERSVSTEKDSARKAIAGKTTSNNKGDGTPDKGKTVGEGGPTNWYAWQKS